MEQQEQRVCKTGKQGVTASPPSSEEIQAMLARLDIDHELRDLLERLLLVTVAMEQQAKPKCCCCICESQREGDL